MKLLSNHKGLTKRPFGDSHEGGHGKLNVRITAKLKFHGDNLEAECQIARWNEDMVRNKIAWDSFYEISIDIQNEL